MVRNAGLSNSDVRLKLWYAIGRALSKAVKGDPAKHDKLWSSRLRDAPPRSARRAQHPAPREGARARTRVIFTDDTNREDFVAQRRRTVENRAAVLGVGPQAIYQAVARGRTARAERDQLLGD